MFFKVGQKAKKKTYQHIWKFDNKITTVYAIFCQFFKISQKGTFWEWRGIVGTKLSYLISFSSKRVKRVRYILIFGKIWILRFPDKFIRQIHNHSFWYPFAGWVKNYCISAISPINISQIGQIATKLSKMRIKKYIICEKIKK